MSLNSVEKALTILLSFVTSNEEVGNLELSERLGLHTSTANRLLQTLVSFDLLQQNPRTKKYSLGKAAFDLGKAIRRSLSTQMVTIAQPYLDDLRDATKETVAFEVVAGSNDKTILAYRAKGLSPLSVLLNVGDSLPLHTSAASKAVLAFCPREVVDRLIKRRLKRMTPATITNPTALKKQLEIVRQQGVAFDHGEFNSEVHAIAAPVFGSEGDPVAAVAVVAPAHRMSNAIESKTVPLVKETAAKISALLFYK